MPFWSRTSRLILVCLFALTVAAVYARAQTTQSASDSQVTVIQFTGDGAAMGTEHGEKLGSTIKMLHEKYFSALLKTQTQKFAARAAAMIFESRLLPEHKQEVQALAKSLNISEADAMLGQCFLDAMPMTACSTVTLPADAAPDHVARFGRDLDFMSFGVADKNTVVIIYKPKDRYAFAAVSWPGMIGVLSGMNEHGLTLANMEVTRPQRLPSAMPYMLLYRSVLEQCKTVDEAIALLDRTPKQTANNLMLMDAEGNRAVVEITPEKIEVRRGKNGAALVSTNHQRGSDDYDSSGKCERFDCLHDQAAERWGKIDVPLLESMLDKSSQGKFTMQSMIFEPSTRMLYLAVGKNAPKHTFQQIDLKSYFTK
jgi:predicted choloylglycine hydrolase